MGVDILEPESFGEYQLLYRTGDIVNPQIEFIEPLNVEMEEFLRSSRPVPIRELQAEADWAL